MAKQTIVKIYDDLDGGDADETLTFALDGIAYEIDLSGKNAKKVRDFLDPYISAGTRTGRVGQPAQLQRHRAQPPVPIAATREQNQAIREWAGQNGFDLAERGRIPQHIVDAYNERKNAKSVVATVKKAAGSKTVSFKPGAKATA